MAAIVERKINSSITLGLISSKLKPINIQKEETNSPLKGTYVLESFLKKVGANLSIESPNSMRLVEKTPLFAEDKVEVMTTKLIIAAAIGKPAKENNSTKGLLSGEI